MPANPKPIVLLDRDGTLIEDRNYLKDPEQVKLLPGVALGLRELSQAGFPLVIITNQSGIGRGLMTRKDVDRVNARLLNMLKRQGVVVRGIYMCPHHPRKTCACRKPKLKLVRQAARDLKRTGRGCISIGDKWIDVQLGQRTGGQGLLVLTGYGRATWKDRDGHKAPVYVARHFKAAARWIVTADKKESFPWIKKSRKG